MPRSSGYLNSLDEPARSRLRAIYGLQAFVTIAGLAVVGIVGLLDYPAQMSLANHLADDPSTIFFFPARTLPIVFPLMLGTIIVFGMLARSVGGVLAGPFKNEWMEFQQAISSSKFLTALCGTAAVLSVLALPLYIGCYSKVTNTGIATNGLFSFAEKQHAWTDVSSVVCEELTRYYRGSRCIDRTYVVSFTDGSSWKLSKTGSEYTGNQSVKGCVDYIAQKTGKQIQYANMDGK